MSEHLPTYYQQLIAASRYSRWDEEAGRRETWEETVSRYVDNVVTPKLHGEDVEASMRLVQEIRQAILNLEVMPSMRMLMTAGPALERDHMAAYNCSFVAMDNPRAFDEILYILTCGTGVGFSCESQFVNKLPEVAESFHDTDTTIVVADSRIGWASSFRELLSLYFLQLKHFLIKYPIQKLILLLYYLYHPIYIIIHFHQLIYYYQLIQ